VERAYACGGRLSGVDLQSVRRAACYFQSLGKDRLPQQIEPKYGIKGGQVRRGRAEKQPPDESNKF